MNSSLRVAFAGTPEFSVPALEALHAAGYTVVGAWTQPDRPAGRGRSLTASAVKERALQLGVPVEQPVTFKSADAVERLKSCAPDLLVVVAYGLILPPPVLDVPRLGCLNIHASLLPRWRGAAPIQRAILAGDTRTGITIMQMDAGLDTGPMLLARAMDILPGETAGELHGRLAGLGAAAVVEAIEAWRAGRITPVPQPADGATYAPKIRKEEAVIDWQLSAAEIARRVRAFNPWPVAETRWRGQQLRVWEAEPLPDAAGAPPGEVEQASGGRLVVATGAGRLCLQRVQLAGRGKVSAAEFLNAHPIAGARLG
jgi:methionyl-tRNA formyltransferase